MLRPRSGDVIGQQGVAAGELGQDGRVAPGDAPVVLGASQVHVGLAHDVAKDRAVQVEPVAHLSRLRVDQRRDDLVIDPADGSCAPDVGVALLEVVEGNRVLRQGAEHGVHRRVILRLPSVQESGRRLLGVGGGDRGHPRRGQFAGSYRSAAGRQ
jgi:hypothetical protein